MSSLEGWNILGESDDNFDSDELEDDGVEGGGK